MLVFLCLACSDSLKVKSFSQPDGGEVIAKRKGVVARRGPKESWKQGSELTGFEAPDDRANDRKASFPSKALVADQVVACERLPNLLTSGDSIFTERLRCL